MNDFFANKVCVITGSGAGLGLALAKQLASMKAIVIIADINFAAAESAAESLKKQGYQVKAYSLDVSNAESMAQWIQDVRSSFQRIDLFFNNAGIAVLGEMRDFNLDLWHRILQVNLFGTLYGIHHILPVMIEQKSGHIVNIASGFGLAPGPINAPYVTSKFAIVGLSEVLRAEAKDFGIDVTVVCPGFIETGLVQSVRILKAKPEDYLKQVPVSMVKVDTAARIILEGVAQKKRRIAFPFYVQILFRLFTLWPSLFLQIGLKQIRQFRKIRRDDL